MTPVDIRYRFQKHLSDTHRVLINHVPMKKVNKTRTILTIVDEEMIVWGYYRYRSSNASKHRTIEEERNIIINKEDDYYEYCLLPNVFDVKYFGMKEGIDYVN